MQPKSTTIPEKLKPKIGRTMPVPESLVRMIRAMIARTIPATPSSSRTPARDMLKARLSGLSIISGKIQRERPQNKARFANRSDHFFARNAATRKYSAGKENKTKPHQYPIRNPSDLSSIAFRNPRFYRPTLSLPLLKLVERRLDVLIDRRRRLVGEKVSWREDNRHHGLRGVDPQPQK